MKQEVLDYIGTMQGTTFAERRANALVELMYEMVHKKEEIEEPIILAKSEEEYVPLAIVEEKPKKTRKKKVKEEVK